MRRLWRGASIFPAAPAFCDHPPPERYFRRPANMLGMAVSNRRPFTPQNDSLSTQRDFLYSSRITGTPEVIQVCWKTRCA